MVAVVGHGGNERGRGLRCLVLTTVRQNGSGLPALTALLVRLFRQQLGSFSSKTYLPTKQQEEAGGDRQERYKMDEYEERTLSVIAPEQEVRFVLLPAEHILCLVLPSFEIRDSKFVNVSTQFRSSSQARGVPAGQFVF